MGITAITVIIGICLTIYLIFAYSHDKWPFRLRKKLDAGKAIEAMKEIERMKQEVINKTVTGMIAQYVLGLSEEEICVGLKEEFKKSNAPDEDTEKVIATFKRRIRTEHIKRINTEK